jgi:hypothetical protein
VQGKCENMGDDKKANIYDSFVSIENVDNKRIFSTKDIIWFVEIQIKGT